MQDINLISEYIDINGKDVLDIGCGKGFFSGVFLDKGAWVFAIDKIDSVGLDVESRNNFIFNVGNIDALDLTDKFDIVFSRNVFSFCDKRLTDLIKKITPSINMGGIFFFTYFGDQESWGKEGKVKTLHRSEIDKILQEAENDFDIKYFAEELFEGKTLNGSIKDWHIFRVILKRK